MALEASSSFVVFVHWWYLGGVFVILIFASGMIYVSSGMTWGAFWSS